MAKKYQIERRFWRRKDSELSGQVEVRKVLFYGLTKGQADVLKRVAIREQGCPVAHIIIEPVTIEDRCPVHRFPEWYYSAGA